MTDNQLAEQHLVDEFGRDCGVIVESEYTGNVYDGLAEYKVWVKEGELMEPLKIGTRVRYHGSLEYRHGIYEITGTDEPMFPATRSYYADGKAYSLIEPGYENNYRNRDRTLYNVRRQSITPLEDS